MKDLPTNVDELNNIQEGEESNNDEKGVSTHSFIATILRSTANIDVKNDTRKRSLHLDIYMV